MNTKTLILMAMQSEADPLIKKLQLKPLTPSPLDPALPFRVWHDTEKELTLMVAGEHPHFDAPWIGTQAAAVMTWEGIKQFNPKKIINAGTAGGVNQNQFKSGQIIFAEKAVYYDRRIDVPGFEKFAVGDFQLASWNSEPSTISGIIASGNSFNSTETDIAIMQNLNAVAVDMELAAIAEIAYLKKIPVYSLKIVSNDIAPESNPAEEFVQSLDAMAERLCDALYFLILSLS